MKFRGLSADTQSASLTVNNPAINRPSGFQDLKSRRIRNTLVGNAGHQRSPVLGRGTFEKTRMIRLFFLPPFSQSANPLFSTSTSPAVSNFFSLKSICSEVESWREKSLLTYQEEVCLVLRLKKEVCRLHYLLREKETETMALRNENDFLKGLIKQSSDGQFFINSY